MNVSIKGKDVIKNTFYEMYKTMPLSKIKVNALTEKSNVSRSTFYFYYEDVYDLYNRCQNDILEYLECGLSDIVMATIIGDSEKYISFVSEDMMRHVDRVELFRVMLNGSEGITFRNIWFDSICKAYEKAMDFAGHGNESYRKKMVRFFGAGHGQLLIDWIEGDDHSSEEARRYAQVSADAMLQGTFKKITL